PILSRSGACGGTRRGSFKTGGRLICRARLFTLSAGRKLSDAESVSSDPRAHQATHVASDMIERAAHGGIRDELDRHWEVCPWDGGQERPPFWARGVCGVVPRKRSP